MLAAVVNDKIGGKADIVPGNNAAIYGAIERDKGEIQVHPDIWLPNQEGFTKNPFQIGQYIENTKAKAAADIARAKSTSEKNELFAGFLEANPHLMGDEAKLMQLRMQLGISSPLGGWSGNYVNASGIDPTNPSDAAVLAARNAQKDSAKTRADAEAEYNRLKNVYSGDELEIALERAPQEVRDLRSAEKGSSYYSERRQRGLSPYTGM